MTPSKENGNRAIVAFDRLMRQPRSPQRAADHALVAEFLAAAVRKLPHDAAFAADRRRRRTARKLANAL